MPYIKFKIKSQGFGSGGTRRFATISNLESDMANTTFFELPIIMKALSRDVIVQEQLPLTFPFTLGAK